MAVPQSTLDLAAGMVDRLFAALPQRRPPVHRMHQAKLIAHRGDQHAPGVRENTYAAFDRAMAAGVWGIECDIRWSADGVPVIFHDRDLSRLYGANARIDQFRWTHLHRQFPSIPRLREMIQRYGGALHLMIEIKQDPILLDPQVQRKLALELQPLRPGTDYHLLSLQPTSAPTLPGIPPRAWVAVSERIPQSMSQWVLAHGWGGVCGHFLLVTKSMLARHHHAGQRVGIGYVASRNSLYREINRGVDWLFSNHAVAMQSLLLSNKT